MSESFDDAGERPIDVDSEFAKIVADFGEVPDASLLDSVVEEPTIEPLQPIEDEHLAYDDDTDHFVPPDPGPLGLPEPRRLAAWIGLIGGPLVMLLLLIFGVDTPPWVGLLLALCFVGGFVTLVATMRPRNDDPWDGNGGAVI